MTRSASPLLAILFMRLCARSAILMALFIMLLSFKPPPNLGSAKDMLRPRDMVLDLLECTLFWGGASVSSISMSSPPLSPPLPLDTSRVRLRPRLSERMRLSAFSVLMPMGPRLSRMASAVSLPRALCLLGRTGLLLAAVFLARCSAIIWRLRYWILARSARSSAVNSSSSLYTWPAAIAASCSRSSSSSSRSSSANLASMSASTKSMMLWPSMISGMMSYFHSESSSKYVFLRSALYTPAPPFSSCKSFSVRLRSPAWRRARASATPAGMTGGREAAAATAPCLGWTIWRSTAALAAFLPDALRLTRASKSLSQAICLTCMTPSSLKVLMNIQYLSSPSSPPLMAPAMPPLEILRASLTIPSMSARSASEISSGFFTSILLQTIITGLLAKSGLMEWNRAACWAMV
mmetsp:Transcript_34329/g.61909  ORF Transcript_34329/g.61909 Transcript_34329/m.61909 type:complete len:407 (-) Transcript_34329:696-1916(-)